MAYLSEIPRQLAPTVRSQALSPRVQVGSAFAGIGETIAIGYVLYFGNIAIVPNDYYWTPARENVVRGSIVPFGDIHVFIGETANGSVSQPDGAAPRPARTAYGLDTIAEDQIYSGRLETIGLIEATGTNLVNPRPTLSALAE